MHSIFFSPKLKVWGGTIIISIYNFRLVALMRNLRWIGLNFGDDEKTTKIVVENGTELGCCRKTPAVVGYFRKNEV